MHGRLKVKTSAQLEAENVAKKEKKLKYFQNTVKQIFELRASFKNNINCTVVANNDEFNDETFRSNANKEEIIIPLLQLTATVLMNNPDIATFWNIRREILLDIEKDCR